MSRNNTNNQNLTNAAPLFYLKSNQISDISPVGNNDVQIMKQNLNNLPTVSK